MLIIGITGNIGCGKTTVSKFFIEDNIPVIDADKVSRHIMNDNDVIREIIEYFGESILKDGGIIDRKKLGSIVFSDDKELTQLNSITHPKIKLNILEKLDNYKKQNKRVVIVDAALLIEANFLDLVDKVVIVTCEDKTQIGRILERDNLTKDEALDRINSQMSQSNKKKYADYIIDNSSTLEELRVKTNKLLVYAKENWCE